MCGCGEWGNTGAHGKVLCKQVKMHYCLCSFDGPGGGGDYSEDEQLDDPDEAQVCVCVRACGVGGHVWTCYTFHPVSLLVTNLTGLKCSIPVGYGGHQSSFCSDPIPGVFLTAPLWHAPHP